MEVRRTRIEITSFVFLLPLVVCLPKTNFHLFMCRCSHVREQNNRICQAEVQSDMPIRNSLTRIWALRKKIHRAQIENDSKTPSKEADGTKERSGTESKPTLASIVHFHLSPWSQFRCIFLISISDFSFFLNSYTFFQRHSVVFLFSMVRINGFRSSCW